MIGRESGIQAMPASGNPAQIKFTFLLPIIKDEKSKWSQLQVASRKNMALSDGIHRWCLIR